MEGQNLPPINETTFHPALIQAVTRHAEFKAELTATWIRSFSNALEQQGTAVTAGFPPGFLLEIGAFAILSHWETTGILPYLPEQLPTSLEATADLRRRIQEDPHQFSMIESAHLSALVFHVWLVSFAWDAPDILNAEVILGHVDEDRLVDAMAELMWTMRHKMQN